VLAKRELLNKRCRYEHFTSKDDYDLSCPVDEDWEKRPQRVLIVLETIDGQDLKERRLLHERSKAVVTNLLKYSIKQAKKEFGFKLKDCSFATVNFNSYKFFDTPKDTWNGHRRKMAKRVLNVVKEMEPTMVLVFGDYAMKALMPNIEFLEKKRGWIFDLDAHGHRCKISGSLDIQPLYSTKKEDASADDDGEEEGDVYGKANLLYYVSRNVTNALAGRNLYDLSDIKVNVTYVNTLKKFKKVYDLINEAEIVAVDTETANGSVNHNKIHTIQLSVSSDKSYFIPVDHPETPFTKKEVKYIKAKLRKFFYAKPGELPLKYLIMQYGIFDLRVLRVELGIPVIFHKVWEIQAGEWCLDENLKYLSAAPFNTPQFGLEQIFMVYGNDYYKTSPFGKGDRANPNLTKLSNPDFIKYGGMDTQSIFGIHEQQIKRAANLELAEKPFTKHFKRLVVKQFSNTVHVLSKMKQVGSSVDREYLKLLAGPNSPLKKLIKEAKADLLEFAEVKAANNLLLGSSSGQASNKGLFGKIQTIFNWGKGDHKKKLFFDVMGLEPISYSKKTKEPKVDKFFIKAYEAEKPVVKKFGEYQKLTKLYGTYVKGWLKVLNKNIDSVKDFRLRPDYAFAQVVTGRLNSSRPSLQQVPARGEAAKYIKRMFIALPGRILIKFDYSAHEIRCWSYVGGDSVLAKAFKQGQKLRQMYRAARDEKEREQFAKDLKTKGDLHIWNAFLFFGKWIEKSDPLRDAIKQIVFGVIYGKSGKTLGKDLRSQRIDDINKKIRALKKEPPKDKSEDEIKKELKVLREKLQYELDNDGVDFAEDIMKKLHKTFPRASAWLSWSMNHAMEHLYTYSPIGLRRNLFGVMTGLNGLVAAMRRRAANSPIQGWASQIGVTTARLIELELWDVLTKFGYIDEDTKEMPTDITKAIHDALHAESPYNIALIVTHVIQWTATYGVTKHYEEEYGVKFTIEPEIEMEFGASEDKMYKWDWSDGQFWKIIKDSLEDQKKLGFCKNPDKAFDKFMEPYRDKKLKAYLDERYPILGIPPVAIEPLTKKKSKEKETA
jgi:DNA polymerase I-like protein with 3'-5' exonuclease and polymerase domains